MFSLKNILNYLQGVHISFTVSLKVWCGISTEKLNFFDHLNDIFSRANMLFFMTCL
jgi:hypothetical protein